MLPLGASRAIQKWMGQRGLHAGASSFYLFWRRSDNTPVELRPPPDRCAAGVERHVAEDGMDQSSETSA